MSSRHERSRTAKERYWRRRLIAEQWGDDMIPDAVSLTPPSPNWVLCARTQIKADGLIYNAGCAVPTSWPNLKSLLITRTIEWRASATAQPIDMPPPASAPQRPSIEIISVPDDPVQSWRLTLQKTTEACGGNAALARDILQSDHTAAQLYKLAERVHQTNVRRRLGAQSLPSAYRSL